MRHADFGGSLVLRGLLKENGKDERIRPAGSFPSALRLKSNCPNNRSTLEAAHLSDCCPQSHVLCLDGYIHSISDDKVRV